MARCGCLSSSNPCANITLDPAEENLIECGPAGLLLSEYQPEFGLTQITSFGHSFGRLILTPSEAKRTFQQRLAAHYRVPIFDMMVSGANLLLWGVNGGGFATIMQSAPPPVRALGWTQPNQQIGIDTFCIGINDLNDYGADADMTQFRAAMVHMWRTVFSWRWAAAFHSGFESVGVVYGGAGWTLPPWFGFTVVLGPGNGTATNASSGRTITITVPDDYAGHVIGVAFMAGYTGGGGNFGALDFTVDAVVTQPIGLPGGLDTLDVQPATVGATGMAVARFQMPDDGLPHTIVVTTNTGGTTFCGWWPESPRPLLVANIARPLDAAYINGSDAKVALMNADLTDVIAEFGAPVYEVDAWTALPKDATLLDFVGLHPNDLGHIRLEKAFHDVLRTIRVDATDWGLL